MDDGMGWIPTEFLLHHLEDLLLAKPGGQALDRGQGFAAIALCQQQFMLAEATR
jgi:hypothetical protein